MTHVHVDPSDTLRPVPALRGTYFGDSPEPLCEEDLDRLVRDTGLTCIRLGMEAKNLADERDSGWKEDGFAYISAVLDWCDARRVRCILDMHNPLGRLYGGDPRLWREEYFKERFVELWRELVRRFRGHPAVAAYEFINEPEPPDDDFAVWNALHRRATAAVREMDPDTPLVVDCIGYANPRHMPTLELNGDPHTVYSFHTYAPGPYHCQKRRELSDQSTYYYPGFIPAKAPDKPKDFNQAHAGSAEGTFWNRARLMEEFRPVFDFRDRHHVPIFCGEFGCVSDVPRGTDLVYLADHIGIFHEQGFSWAMYNTMFRTADPYWTEHFDCGLYIVHSPQDRVYCFRRKIALLEFFCRTEGDVLRYTHPSDDFVGLYAVRDRGHTTHILLTNKDRADVKTVSLTVAGLPDRWRASLKTLGHDDDGFVPRGPRELFRGSLELTLPPLTLAIVEIPAPGLAAWR
jgi:endoglucanase